MTKRRMLELMKNISEIEGINCGTGYIGLSFELS